MVTEEKTQTSQKLTYSSVDEIKLKKEGGFPKKGKIALGILGVLMDGIGHQRRWLMWRYFGVQTS